MRLRDGTTMVLRLVHIQNLETCIRRGALHAANHAPHDSLPWIATHRGDVQQARATRSVNAGPGGTLLDYVPFYFGQRSPMLYQLHTGQVEGFGHGQENLVYLVASAHDIAAAGHEFVFYDGHALARVSLPSDDLAHLDQLDWTAIAARIWNNTVDDPDRQRRKQAEFLVYRQLPWGLVRGLVVLDALAERRIRGLYSQLGCVHRPEVVVRPDWYY